MVTKEEFREYCKNLMLQDEKKNFKGNNKKRNSVLGKVVFIETMVFFASTIFVIIILQSFIFVLPMFISYILTILVSRLIIWYIINPKYREIKNKYAYEVLKYLLNGYKFTYSPNEFIDKKIFFESAFSDILTPNVGSINLPKIPGELLDLSINGIKICNTSTDEIFKYTGEDLLKLDIPKDDGTPSGIELEICDLHITRQKDEPNNHDDDGSLYFEKRETYNTNIFDGTFGHIHFPFNFKCCLGINKKVNGTKKIELEDIKFNQEVKVFTDNQLEAVVILTPSLMSRLMAFNKKIDNFQLYLAPSGDMYFKMARNLFAIKANGTEDMMFDRFYDDICNILAIVNEIRDNNKIFKM